MKKNKGFSIVELIVSFTLTMAIVIVLFEIIVSMKNLYVSSATKTELLNKQNLFTDYIYSDIDNYGLNSISVCGDDCIALTYDTGITKNLRWSFYSDENVSQVLQSLSYGDYKINLITGASFDTSISASDEVNTLKGVKICSNPVDQYISIKLPIHHKSFKDEDFGIKLLYVYDLGEISIDLPLSTNC